MTNISVEDWERIRQHFGDLAYEHPELHSVMLDLIESTVTPEANDNLK